MRKWWLVMLAPVTLLVAGCDLSDKPENLEMISENISTNFAIFRRDAAPIIDKSKPEGKQIVGVSVAITNLPVAEIHQIILGADGEPKFRAVQVKPLYDKIPKGWRMDTSFPRIHPSTSLEIINE